MDTETFNAFKVVIDLPEKFLTELQSSLSHSLTLDDAKTAWVPIHVLENWDGLKGRTEWQTGLAAMIDAAEPYGWVDRRKQAIKAHIEWTPAPLD